MSKFNVKKGVCPFCFPNRTFDGPSVNIKEREPDSFLRSKFHLIFKKQAKIIFSYKAIAELKIFTFWWEGGEDSRSQALGGQQNWTSTV